MFCAQCGAHNEDDAVFCGECGVVLRLGELPQAEEEGGLGLAAAEPSGAAQEGPGQMLRPDEPEQSQQPPLGQDDVEDWAGTAAPPSPSAQFSAPDRVSSVPTSGLAIASLLLGVGGLTILPLIGSVLAVLFGYMARNDIRRRPTQVSGDGLAVAGIVMGWVVIGATALVLALAMLGVVAGICGFGLCGIAGSTTG